MSTTTTTDATGTGAPAAGFGDLAASRAVLLTTFRQNGEEVRTPVWLVIRDGKVYATTPASSGKVKRIRREPRVLIAPCTQTGKPTGPVREGRARIMTAAEKPPVQAAMRRRYRVLDRLFSLINRLQGEGEEVALEIVAR